jgi:hypothetical protein
MIPMRDTIPGEDPSIAVLKIIALNTARLWLSGP